jgi:hypothetical protein
MPGAPDAEVRPLVEQPFSSPDDVLTRLKQLEALFKGYHKIDDSNGERDYRWVFPLAYVQATELVIANQIANQPDAALKHWLEQYLCSFANEYRRALLASVSGADVALPWKIVFDAAVEKQTRYQNLTHFQHLTLSMNAHIFYDLPLVLATLDRGDPGEPHEARKALHTSINSDLWDNSDAVIERLSEAIAALSGISILVIIANLSGSAKKTLVEMFQMARQEAWSLADDTEPAALDELRAKRANYSKFFADTIIDLQEPQGAPPEMDFGLALDAYRTMLSFAPAWFVNKLATVMGPQDLTAAAEMRAKLFQTALSP